MGRRRSPAWRVDCERAARRTSAGALAVVAGEWLANIGGTIGSRPAGVKPIRTAPVRIGGVGSGWPAAYTQRAPSTSMHTPLMNAASSLAR